MQPLKLFLSHAPVIRCSTGAIIFPDEFVSSVFGEIHFLGAVEKLSKPCIELHGRNMGCYRCGHSDDIVVVLWW